MRAKLTRVSAALLCAITWGIGAPASAQDPTPAQEPVVLSPPSSPDMSAVPSEPSAQLEPSDEAASLPTSVPTYEPPAYALTPPGSAGNRRSEALTWPNRPLMLTSTLVFTAAYVPTVLTRVFSKDDTTDNLYIPVAGPWLEIARENANTANTAAMAISGVFQGLGALGMVTSLLVPERRTSRWYLLGNKRLAISPAASPYVYGVSANGQF